MPLSEKNLKIIKISIAILLGIVLGIILYFTVIKKHDSTESIGNSNNPLPNPNPSMPKPPGTCKPNCKNKDGSIRVCGNDGCGGYCTDKDGKQCKDWTSCSDKGICVKQPEPVYKPSSVRTISDPCTTNGNNMYSSSNHCAGCCDGLLPYLINTNKPESIYKCLDPYGPLPPIEKGTPGKSTPPQGWKPGDSTVPQPVIPPCVHPDKANWLNKIPYNKTRTINKYTTVDDTNEYSSFFKPPWIDLKKDTNCSVWGPAGNFCNDNEQQLKWNSCGFLHWGVTRKCIKNQWDNSNLDSCCYKSPNVQSFSENDPNSISLNTKKCSFIDGRTEKLYSGNDVVWAPWTGSCKSNPRLKKYCSDIDPVTAQSRLISGKGNKDEPPCVKWSNDSVNANDADEAVGDFCGDLGYPTAPECVCYDTKNNIYYNRLMAQGKSLGIDIKDTNEPICNVPVCFNSDKMLLNNKNKDLLKKCTVKQDICGQIENVKDKEYRDLVVNKDIFKIICGKEMKN